MKVAASIVKELYSLTNSEDKGTILAEYKSCLETIGKSVMRADGMSGVAVDVTCDGALIVECDGQTKEISWGVVCYVK
jgi:biotin-(acetyl-CoA carboxylase) ligase